MHDEYVSRAVVIAALLWATSVGWVAATWIMATAGVPIRYELAMALTGVLVLTCAAVWQVRLYSLRISALIRIANGLDGPDADMHSIARPRSGGAPPSVGAPRGAN